MSKIRLLPDDVVQRIAAGEIVSKASNAIKEVVENALDAASTHIQIDINQFSIKITDNGNGISLEDAPLLCTRHATSKLCEYADLEKIETFGFRGEALAAISHISRLSVSSKCVGDVVGWTADYANGRLVGEAKAVAHNGGTIISISDLFYNYKLRRKIDFKDILSIVQQFAIAFSTRCAFSLKRAGKMEFVSPKVSSAECVVSSIKPLLSERHLLRIDPTEIIKECLVSNAYWSQPTSMTFIMFVNDRLVDFPALKNAIRQLYVSLLLKNRHPWVFINLRIPSDEIDVNVHPAKATVIIKEEQMTIDHCIKCIQKSLESTGILESHIPAITTPATLYSSPNTKTIHSSPKGSTPKRPYELIHTDWRDQTLDEFASPKSFLARISQQSECESGENVIKHTKMVDDNSAEKIIVDDTVNNNTCANHGNFKTKLGQTLFAKKAPTASKESTDLEKDILIDSPIAAASRSKIKTESMRILRQHVFIGSVNDTFFFQFESSLYMANINTLLGEYLQSAKMEFLYPSSEIPIPLLIKDDVDGIDVSSLQGNIIDKQIFILKKILSPSQCLALLRDSSIENDSIELLTNTHELYKIFERC